MAHIFGGGAFTGHPGSQCRLAGAAPHPQPGAGVIPRAFAVPVRTEPEPQRNLRGPAPVAPPASFAPHPLIGPRSYPVMRKGEAPCPVCH